jgi:hypothetical protein
MMQCNFCTMEDFRRLATLTNRVVTVLPDRTEEFPEGVAVYIHPAEEGAKGWWAGWFGKFPTACACRRGVL